MDIGWNMAAYMGVRASRELEVVSHNLANASTLGFKRELLNNWQLNTAQNPLIGEPEAAQYVDVRSHDFNQGSIHETGKRDGVNLAGYQRHCPGQHGPGQPDGHGNV
jgi:flagellar basal body rod protein FlgG